MPRTYVGKFVNPTENMTIEETEDGRYQIMVVQYCECGNSCCSRPVVGTRPHTNKNYVFDEHEDAIECLEGLREHFEEDYERYLEENHDAICQQERYEDFMNER